MTELNGIGASKFVVFSIAEQRYALPLETVETVVRMVEITELPGAPEFIRGVINFHGDVIPVLDLRKKFSLGELPIKINDQLVIINFKNKHYSVIADVVNEVLECTEEDIDLMTDIVPDMPFLNGVVKLSEGIILLNNPDTLFNMVDVEQGKVAYD